jgi:hypothetical protein
MRFVYYSLANAPGSPWEQQWMQSIRSLRRYNATVPVYLFLYNGASAELMEEAARRGVVVHYIGDYCSYLSGLHVRGSILALFPTFHKFLSLTHGPMRDVSQVLYLDCDTFFFDDVELLFDRHSSCDWCAREEPRSQRSHYGNDPSHIDELVLGGIAAREGLRLIAPFNSGVCVLNNGIWRSFDRIRISNLDLAWRLLAGCELGANNGVERDQTIRSAVLDAITDHDRSRALQYPSSNPWIIEQIALWLALGHLPQLSQGLLSQDDVAQGGEFRDALESGSRYVVAHYFSNLEDEFFHAVPRISA